MQQSKWRTDLNEGFYAAGEGSLEITPADLQAAQCGVPFAYGCGGAHYSQESVGFRNETGFYDPTFGGGNVKLQPLDPSQYKIANCQSEPQPHTTTYPNDINSAAFRKVYGYGN